MGFWFHLRMNFYTPGVNLFEKSIYGAPPMAPLLFPNLVALALIGLWQLASAMPAEESGETGTLDHLLRWASTLAAEQEA